MALLRWKMQVPPPKSGAIQEQPQPWVDLWHLGAYRACAHHSLASGDEEEALFPG